MIGIIVGYRKQYQAGGYIVYLSLVFRDAYLISYFWGDGETSHQPDIDIPTLTVSVGSLVVWLVGQVMVFNDG